MRRQRRREIKQTVRLVTWSESGGRCGRAPVNNASRGTLRTRCRPGTDQWRCRFGPSDGLRPAIIALERPSSLTHTCARSSTFSILCPRRACILVAGNVPTRIHGPNRSPAASIDSYLLLDRHRVLCILDRMINCFFGDTNVKPIVLARLFALTRGGCKVDVERWRLQTFRSSMRTRCSMIAKRRRRRCWKRKEWPSSGRTILRSVFDDLRSPSRCAHSLLRHV